MAAGKHRKSRILKGGLHAASPNGKHRQKSLSRELTARRASSRLRNGLAAEGQERYESDENV